MINWKIRARNRNFWAAIIPAAVVLAQAVASVFGVELDLGNVGDRLVDVADAVFVVLAILGIVTDPTTPGVSDSERAMAYVVPGEDGKLERTEDEDRDD